MGRYTQADPIGLAASLNLFKYVDGNPVNRYDARGLLSVDKSCAGLCCEGALRDAVDKFNNFWKPGWSTRKPKCQKILEDMSRRGLTPLQRGVSRPRPADTPITPLTCMVKWSESMIVKCANRGSNQGGPPTLGDFDAQVVWIQPAGCRNASRPNHLFETIFHEAAHNCGAPDDPLGTNYLGTKFDRTAYEVEEACAQP